MYPICSADPAGSILGVKACDWLRDGQSGPNVYPGQEVGKGVLLPWMSGCELSGPENRSEDAVGLNI